MVRFPDLTQRTCCGLFVLYWLLGMHFFMHNPGGAGLYLPFNAWGWIFASLVIGLGLWRVTLQQRLVFSSLQGWLWLGALLLLLPMAYPGFELKDYAIPRLLGLFAGLLFLFCLYQWQLVRASRDRLLYLLLGAVAIEALLGLVQYYLLIPGNWLGYDTRANRPYGIFQQPNVMATFMATGLALGGWLELRGNANPWLKGLRYGVSVAASLLLVALQSRVGQLGGLAGAAPAGARAASSSFAGQGAGAGRARHLAGDRLPVRDQRCQTRARGLSVGRHALHLLALCRQADCPVSLGGLGLWQL